jgi:hypothetical protein
MLPNQSGTQPLAHLPVNFSASLARVIRYLEGKNTKCLFPDLRAFEAKLQAFRTILPNYRTSYATLLGMAEGRDSGLALPAGWQLSVDDSGSVLLDDGAQTHTIIQRIGDGLWGEDLKQEMHQTVLYAMADLSCCMDAAAKAQAEARAAAARRSAAPRAPRTATPKVSDAAGAAAAGKAEVPAAATLPRGETSSPMPGELSGSAGLFKQPVAKPRQRVRVVAPQKPAAGAGAAQPKGPSRLMLRLTMAGGAHGKRGPDAPLNEKRRRVRKRSRLASTGTAATAATPTPKRS